MEFVSKLPHVETTIFSVMSQLANECNAINLAQGFPDFHVPTELIDLVSLAMQNHNNQYPPMIGVQALREAIAEKAELMYDITVDADKDITVTAGATEALFCAIMATVKIGDEVIIFDPAYDSYEPVITLAGGKTVHIDLCYPDYHIDWDQVKSKINQKTKMIILNTPNNPTGSILKQQDIECLIDLTSRRDIYILSDEVYEHIVFDNEQHLSMLRIKELRERSFVVFSFGKTYHCTGWKVGYCIAPSTLTNEFRKIHQYNTFTVSTPMQVAFAEFLKNRDHYLVLSDFYQDKRDYFLERMKGSRFEPLPCKGTYFQLFNYTEICDELDLQYAKKLTKEVGVASIPISVFFSNRRDDKVLRFCFAKDEVTLDKAAEILCKI